MVVRCSRSSKTSSTSTPFLRLFHPLVFQRLARHLLLFFCSTKEVSPDIRPSFEASRERGTPRGTLASDIRSCSLGFTEEHNLTQKRTRERERERGRKGSFISFSTGRTMSPSNDSFIFQPFCKPFVLRALVVRVWNLLVLVLSLSLSLSLSSLSACTNRKTSSFRGQRGWFYRAG